MEINGMYLNKGNEWKRMKWNGIKSLCLDVLKWRNGNKWNVGNFFSGSNIEGK